MAVLLAVALAIRLGWTLYQPSDIDPRLPDQQEYLESARNLLVGQGLRFTDPDFGWVQVAYRMPGYPLFLAAVGGSVKLARIAQALVDTSTVLAIYLLARKWLDHGPSLIAAALVAFNPFLVYFSALILSETLFTAMLAWGAVLLARRNNFLWGGIVLALSIHVRPSAVAMPIVLGISSVFLHPRPAPPPQQLWWKSFRLPVGATMLLLIVVCLFPWALRNRIVLGKWIWLTTNGGVTRYDGFNPEATGASNQSFLHDPEISLIRNASEIERDEALNQRANQWIAETWRERPSHLLKLTVAKIARTWSPIPLSRDFGSNRLHLLAALLYSIPLDLLVVLGIWKSGLARAAKVFLLLPAVYFTAVHAMSVGSLRYRVPVEPLLAVVAAAGLILLSWSRPGWRRIRNNQPGGLVQD